MERTELIFKLVVSVAAIAAFVGFIVMLFKIPVPGEMRDVVMTMGGILGGAFTTAIGYWLGSSQGSARKDQTITDLSANANPNPKP